MSQFRGDRRTMADYNLADELSLLTPKMKQALLDAVYQYRKTGVRFALCGGLAVGSYGEPRATRDVDFLVGDEAFNKTGLTVSFAHSFPLTIAGISIDAIPLPLEKERAAKLDRALSDCWVDSSLGYDVPVLAPRWLAYMKLAVGRPKDYADIASMLESGAVTREDLFEVAEGDLEMRSELDQFLARLK